ncbi:hypothetical protein L210DRAFT_3527141 [Boletus edulis BED1]|uniref:Uncharacterized protein n=1 Tax=Boletus edulis BED1 TaxID=1328754 RepID=A0AAD4C4X6_BOLED|nr:hypothetical protein L210DRAFT_3527141 [Boletus edulis BED1]
MIESQKTASRRDDAHHSLRVSEKVTESGHNSLPEMHHRSGNGGVHDRRARRGTLDSELEMKTALHHILFHRS